MECTLLSPVLQVIPVTEDAELLLAVRHQVIFIIGAHGIVAGDAGERMPGPRVQDLGTDGMGKSPLMLMTAGADLGAVSLEHCQLSAAMGFMAVAAVIDIVVFIRTVTELFHGIPVTGGADLRLAPFEQ